MIELKACPFCGEAAKIGEHRQHESGDLRSIHIVGCNNDDCGVQPEASVAGPWGYARNTDPPSDEAAKASAVASWNRRVGV